MQKARQAAPEDRHGPLDRGFACHDGDCDAIHAEPLSARILKEEQTLARSFRLERLPPFGVLERKGLRGTANSSFCAAPKFLRFRLPCFPTTRELLFRRA